MVRATNYTWRGPPHCTWQSPNLNSMSSSLEPLPQGCLPAPADMSPGTCMFSANMAIPGFARVLNLKAQQSNEVCSLPHYLLPHFRNLLPVSSPCRNEKTSVFSSGVGMQAAANTTPQGQKGFIIFDRSANGTRVLYSPFKSTIPRTTTAATKPFFGYDLQNGKGASRIEQMNLAKPTLHNVLDENHLSVEETEMHEDTEEINALLYSDEDGYDSYSDDDDDEVASTGHSPVTFGLSYGTQKQEDVTAEEVASSDVPNKRRKLMDGTYEESSLADTASSIKVEGSHGCAESMGQIQEEETASDLGNKQLRKDKILSTLKVLKSIVPGSKRKDPLLVLDEAIEYLKSLKLKAKSLGIDYC